MKNGHRSGQPAADRESGQLRPHSKPVLDRGDVQVELGRHANPRLVGPLESTVRGTRFAGLDRRAERLRKGDYVRC